MTPKQRVLKRWPDAECADVAYWRASPEYSVGVVKSDRVWHELGTGPTPAAAWKDAAERMRK